MISLEKTYCRVRLTSCTSQKLAGLSLLNDPRSKMESENGRCVPFLIVISEFFRFSFPDRKWVGLVGFDIRWGGLDI